MNQFRTYDHQNPPPKGYYWWTPSKRHVPPRFCYWDGKNWTNLETGQKAILEGFTGGGGWWAKIDLDALRPTFTHEDRENELTDAMKPVKVSA